MITLYNFGPAFGLPDPSPFVMKTETLLKMAKLPYRTDSTGFAKAPKGKIPYIDDDGVVVPDSTFIRWHIEKKIPHRLRSGARRRPARDRLGVRENGGGGVSCDGAMRGAGPTPTITLPRRPGAA